MRTRSGTLKPLIFLYLSGLFCSAPGYASDIDKEKYWSAQIINSLRIGDAITLKSNKGEFLGLHAEATTAKIRGAAIIMHGMGAHPNAQNVIFPLRTELPKRGWATLSIQMPILKGEAPLKDYIPLLDEVTPRINAAIKFLKNKNHKNIVLIGHSLGATMGTIYMGNKPDTSIRAFIAIGLGHSSLDPRFDNVANLVKITSTPVLDILGSQDFENILQYADKRATKSKRVNKKYRQKKSIGANHFFTGMNSILVKTVYSWIAYNAPGTEILK